MADSSSNNSEQTDKISPQEPKYWLSLEQWAKSPELDAQVETEFNSSPLREGETSEDGVARRDFLKLMGASMALATAGCIRRPVQKIVPYNKQPEEVTLGVANYYTSTWFDGSEVFGLLIKTREGRPIKVEGNPEHPANQGALSARAQAHILNLYDPDRLKNPIRNLINKDRRNRDTVKVKWEEADDAIVKQLKKGSVVVLTGSLASPSTRAVVSDFCQGFRAKHITYDPISYEEIREGQLASYGDSSIPAYRFDRAKMVVSIDGDFLGTLISPVSFTRQFMQGRKNLANMNQLVSFESMYTLTGANADTRFRIKPSQQQLVAMGLAHEIVIKKGLSRFAGNAVVKAALEPFADAAQQLGIDSVAFRAVADSLWQARGNSLVIAGGLAGQTATGKETQIAVNFLNALLDNEGKTIVGKAGPSYLKSEYKAMLELIASMKKGEVKSLIIHGVNPMYSLPMASDFLEGLTKLELVVYTGDRNDETGQQANFVLPDNHPMEAWGDSEYAEGVYSIQQPTIRPLYDTRSFQLSLMSWAYLAETGPKRLTTPETYYDFVRSYWKEEIYPKHGRSMGFETFWDEALQKGMVGSSKEASARNFRTESISQVKPVKSTEAYELVLYPSIALGDGSLANISWLQELPDPVTKIVWDNYVSVSINTAAELKAKEGEVFKIKVGEQSISLPIHIQPGQQDGVLSVAIGYGRKAVGSVGNRIGQNAMILAQSSPQKGLVTSGLSAALEKTGEKIELASTQGHHILSKDLEARNIVREVTQAEFASNPDTFKSHHHITSIWSGFQYNGNKWGMAVDLNTCTGCSACVVACQSENNIPVVGKKYILQGREMQWIRIDRYYSGDPKDPRTVFQPVMCQQCDNAPCETVCPVIATAHSSEGLNDMVYNRCVGTRYCANNCPYKVRRFNWFKYTQHTQKPLHLALNPEVTVRPRGVMEKCTFCVHRIKTARSTARIEQRELKDGDIKTACQQTCPSDAIVFGDVNDPNSRVAKLMKEDPRAYALLEEFNAAPAVRYLGKIRNGDNHKMVKADKGGHA